MQNVSNFIRGLVFLSWTLLLLSTRPLSSQIPFVCESQVFLLDEAGLSIVNLSITPGNNVLNFDNVNSATGTPIGNLAYRSADGLIYSIGLNDKHLYQIDVTGNLFDLGPLSLNPSLSYLAGEIDPSGQYFYAFGTDGNIDVEMVKIDLTNNNTVETIPLGATNYIADIAFDPHSSQLFGYDQTLRQIVTINTTSGNTNSLQTIDPENEISGIYFDAFGQLKAFGTALSNVVSAIFDIDKTTGEETLFSTTGLRPILDLTACPYGIAIRSGVNPQSSFPCNEISYTYTVANASQSLQTGVSLQHELPFGFEILNVVQNPYGGIIDATAPANLLQIDNMNLSTGVKTMEVQVYIDDLPGGEYNTKVQLENLPVNLGSLVDSDDPNTPTFGDSTSIEINRFEQDSLLFDQFLCLGQSTVLDASDFGNNLQWNNGSTLPMLDVSQAGTYTLEAVSGCQTLFVSYEVVTASCPYTIELGHSIIPDTIFPCTEVTFRYYLYNDTGLDRPNMSFTDTLPATFTLVDVVPNVYGGTVTQGLAPNIVEITGMNLVMGTDSFDLIVEIGDISPGNYLNGAEIGNLPSALGTQRFSDDPNTQLVDDTRLVVLGVESDTFFVDTTICPGTLMILDASQYGKTFIWPDGSTASTFNVMEEGLYEVLIFDGCEPSSVYFDVQQGTPIQLSIGQSVIELHQGDSVQLMPLIINSGDSLSLLWSDPLGNSLSCLECPDPMAMPLSSTNYQLFAANERCQDSIAIQFLIDDRRRIYAPNAFSPNGDGINDYFYLQSPDFADVTSLKIFDRWGGIVFDADVVAINNEKTGWDGFTKGEKAVNGLYTWMASIKFIDQRQEVLSGDLILLK